MFYVHTLVCVIQFERPVLIRRLTAKVNYESRLLLLPIFAFPVAATSIGRGKYYSCRGESQGK